MVQIVVCDLSAVYQLSPVHARKKQTNSAVTGFDIARLNPSWSAKRSESGHTDLTKL